MAVAIVLYMVIWLLPHEDKQLLCLIVGRQRKICFIAQRRLLCDSGICLD